MGMDDFNTSNLDVQVQIDGSVGGTWRGENGATCDFIVATEQGKRLTNPLAVARDFEATMQRLTQTLGATKAEIDKLARQVVDTAIDQQVRDIFRRRRVETGNTDHKKMLELERVHRGLTMMSRAGIELGWLFGLDIRWDWEYVRPENRVYDWEFDCRW